MSNGPLDPSLTSRRPELLELGINYLSEHQADFIAAYIAASNTPQLSEEEIRARATQNFLGILKRLNQPAAGINPRMAEAIRLALRGGETSEEIIAQIESNERAFTQQLQKVPVTELAPAVKEALLRRVRVIVDHHFTNVRMIAANYELEKVNNPDA